MSKESVIRKLKDLTGKKNIIFTRRCNRSILAALRYIKLKGFDTIMTQDQGGWITYSQFATKLRLKEKRVKTDFGLLKSQNYDFPLIINSMPGYHALEDLSKISTPFLINDICGSIGTEQALFGDIIVCSFGRWKPINLGQGGFIATNLDTDFFNEYAVELDFELLEKKLDTLKDRLEFLHGKCWEVKSDLKKFGVIHPKAEGLNVIVKFESEPEKEKLINYCNEKNLEYEICPRYIRVNDDALSIEIKRLE